MIIRTTKKFDKQYAKLTEKNKKFFKIRMAVFKPDPFDARLRNHALKGKYLGYRSIDITGDIRALYYIKDNAVIIFAFIGSHSQLY